MGIKSTGLSEAGLRSEFFKVYDPVVDDALFQKVAQRIVSTKDVEHHKWLGSLPSMEELGPGLKLHGLRSESYDVANLKYATGLEVDQDEVDDDQTGQIKIRVQQLAEQAALHKDELLGDLLENGGSTGFVAYDGQIFFSASHASGASGSQDNDLTSVVADGDTNVFTAAEGKAALQAAIKAMMSFKDDRGRPMKIKPTGLMLVCPPAQMFNWMEVLNTALISNTDNIMKGVANVVSFGELTTSGRWYLLKTDGIVQPFIFQDRVPLTFTYSDEDMFKRSKHLYKVDARYRMAYAMWQYAIRYVFTT